MTTITLNRARTVTVPFTVYRRYLAYRLVPCTAGIHHSGTPVKKSIQTSNLGLLVTGMFGSKQLGTGDRCGAAVSVNNRARPTTVGKDE